MRRERKVWGAVASGSVAEDLAKSVDAVCQVVPKFVLGNSGEKAMCVTMQADFVSCCGEIDEFVSPTWCQRADNKERGAQ